MESLSDFGMKNIGPNALNVKTVFFAATKSKDGAYIARAVGFSIFVQASADELKAAIKDAVSCHFKDGERTRSVRLHIAEH